MSATRKIVVDRGPKAKLRIVWGSGANERYLGEDFFLDECSEDQQSKFRAVFELVADTGFCRNEKLFRYPLDGCGNIGEFKTFKKRLYFYRESNDLIITHGATKKENTTDRKDIDRTNRIRLEIEEREK
ncbi:type II toxin-antitoxin system RelE/ParE family toxin [Myxococcus faecalis]|uniref:type II toxin-antitoxin system RelE/ParE family toxin n=1 Tax=Myxococcus faecalis TaxID=3115646 RepID=UPI003CF1B807